MKNFCNNFNSNKNHSRITKMFEHVNSFQTKILLQKVTFCSITVKNDFSFNLGSYFSLFTLGISCETVDFVVIILQKKRTQNNPGTK